MKFKSDKRINWFLVVLFSWLIAIALVQINHFIYLQKRKPVFIGKVSCYMYNPVKSQTDSSPHYTSIGEKVQEGIIAVSQDLLGKVNYYDMVYIKELDRYFYVMDCMHKKQKNSVDIFSWNLKQSKAFGRHKFTLYLCKKMQKHDGKEISDFRVYGKIDENKIKILNEDYLK